MKIKYKIEVGYVDIDNCNKFNECEPFRFIVIDLENEDDKCIVKYFGDSSLEQKTDIYEFPNIISQYIIDNDLIGRSKDIVEGTIKCSIDKDEDGLMSKLKMME